MNNNEDNINWYQSIDKCFYGAVIASNMREVYIKHMGELIDPLVEWDKINRLGSMVLCMVNNLIIAQITSYNQINTEIVNYKMQEKLNLINMHCRDLYNMLCDDALSEGEE